MRTEGENDKNKVQESKKKKKKKEQNGIFLK
jgi:hypothetical protein